MYTDAQIDNYPISVAIGYLIRTVYHCESYLGTDRISTNTVSTWYSIAGGWKYGLERHSQYTYTHIK